MVGSDLSRTSADRVPVVLRGGDGASGLASMLHQFLEQTLDSSTDKARRARLLSGSLLFRAAEDPAIAVRISFGDGRVEVSDQGSGTEPGDRAPSLTSDFLSTAHLTTGESSPLALVLARKIKASFALRQVWFLLCVLHLMRIDDVDARGRRRWRAIAAIAVVSAVIVTAIVALLWLAHE